MCDCVKIEYALTGVPVTTTIEVNTLGLYNGANYYTWTIGVTPYYLFFDGTTPGNWLVTEGGLGFPTWPLVAEWKIYGTTCPPLGSMPTWITGTFDTFTTSNCDSPAEVGPCQCGINVTLSADGVPPQTVTAVVDGLYNNRLQFTFILNGVRYYIRWNASAGHWEIINPKAIPPVILGVLALDILCPIGDLDDWTGYLTYEFYTESADCVDCLEDRHKKEFNVIRLPETFTEQNRGFIDCCCEYMVLASEDPETWKNDITSAWVKLSDAVDVQEFKIYKDGVDTGEVPTVFNFPNEENAKYITVYWKEILFSYGPGCYDIRINYDISGITGSLIWGKYVLQLYTIQNALKTARVRVKFNGFQQTEGLDFTGTNIESTLRFYGYIGNRQANAETDNIIYENREMRRVIRENINSYEIITDPSLECIIKPLLDLYLLSENELYISDYNAHNHSYRFLDLPVIVEESPEVEYYDFSRKAKLTCKVGDKFKTNRTYYK